MSSKKKVCEKYLLDADGYVVIVLERGKIDPFDFETYKKEYALFSKYFENSDLYIRVANWILYKYEYLKTDAQRKKLYDELNNASDRQSFLDKMTTVTDVGLIAKRWYLHFNPDKAGDDHINLILTKYSSDILKLWKNLYFEYVTKPASLE